MSEFTAQSRLNAGRLEASSPIGRWWRADPVRLRHDVALDVVETTGCPVPPQVPSWPAMYKDFRLYCRSRHPKPGTLWAWMGADGKRLVSLFTQEAIEGHHGGIPGPASLQRVGHALRDLARLAETEKFTSIALPRIATGVGRLAWSDVKPLLDQHLGDLKIPVLVYTTYHAKQQANEDL